MIGAILKALLIVKPVFSSHLIVSGLKGNQALLEYSGYDSALIELVQRNWKKALRFFIASGRQKVPRELAQDLKALGIEVDYSVEGLKFQNLMEQEGIGSFPVEQ